MLYEVITPGCLGEISLKSEPVIKQVFVKGNYEQDQLEVKMYVARKVAERAIRESGMAEHRAFYLPSLSSKVFIYKGMLTPEQVGEYFLDLQNPKLTSAIALVHSRFSTNTFPTWDLAQPFRFLAHNGEINTIRGNRLWMQAREALLKSDIFVITSYSIHYTKLYEVEVSMAADGIEALTKITSTHDYDVIIMDYNMPLMNGIEVIRYIREKLNLPTDRQPIIFLHSSSDDENIFRECAALGVKQTMMKPVKMSQLMYALSHLNKADNEEAALLGITPVDDYNGLKMKPYKVLVVEDNKTNMLLASAIILKILPEAILYNHITSYNVCYTKLLRQPNITGAS